MDDWAWIPAECRHLPGLQPANGQTVDWQSMPPTERLMKWRQQQQRQALPLIPPHAWTGEDELLMLAACALLAALTWLLLPWQMAWAGGLLVWAVGRYKCQSAACDLVCDATLANRLIDIDATIAREAQEFAATGQIASMVQLEQCTQHKRRAWYCLMVTVCIVSIWLLFWYVGPPPQSQSRAQRVFGGEVTPHDVIKSTQETTWTLPIVRGRLLIDTKGNIVCLGPELQAQEQGKNVIVQCP